MTKIRVAIVGVGNCASSLVQGIHYYQSRREEDAIGLMHWDLGGYLPSDVEVVAAFDVDRRKVGRDVSEAIFAAPNCTAVFCDEVPKVGVPVRMGKVLDGFSEHMRSYDEQRAFVIADALEADHHEVAGCDKKPRRKDGAGERRRDPGELPAGRIRESHPLLRGVRSGSGRGPGQLHPGLHCQ